MILSIGICKQRRLLPPCLLPQGKDDFERQQKELLDKENIIKQSQVQLGQEQVRQINSFYKSRTHTDLTTMTERDETIQGLYRCFRVEMYQKGHLSKFGNIMVSYSTMALPSLCAQYIQFFFLIFSFFV